MRLNLGLRERLSLRLERRGLQARAALKGRELTALRDRTAEIPAGPVVFSTMRNEAMRLPWFLDYYRKLGIVHFLVVDNGSTDGTTALLSEAEDVSVWTTDGSYRASQFGVDWLNHLLTRYGAGRWVLVVDPDELLVYPNSDTRRLPALIRWLESQGRDSLGTLLLDLYGKEAVAETICKPGQDPLDVAPWFDANNYFYERHNRYHNIWIQGGPRMRVHFGANPRRAPALNKTPLVRWRKGYMFHTSTHTLLPRRLNRTYARVDGTRTTGALLHTKFLSVLTEKVAEEMQRKQHYDGSAEYRAYAARGGSDTLWTEQSVRYAGWQQLCDLGLMSRGGWL